MSRLEDTITGRELTIEAIKEKIDMGIRLSEEDVNEHLHLARDYTLLRISLSALEGAPANKEQVSQFNALQNAVERHEMMHPENNGEKGKIVWSVKSTETEMDLEYEDETIN